MARPSLPAPVRIATTAAITARASTQNAMTAVAAPARWRQRAKRRKTTR